MPMDLRITIDDRTLRSASELTGLSDPGAVVIHVMERFVTAVTAGTRMPLVLVDTCVWIDHDRVGVPLQDLLLQLRVVTSSDVVNELLGCRFAP